MNIELLRLPSYGWFPGEVIQSISAGYGHAVALTTSGEMYLWGMKVSVGCSKVFIYLTLVVAELDGAAQSKDRCPVCTGGLWAELYCSNHRCRGDSVATSVWRLTGGCACLYCQMKGTCTRSVAGALGRLCIHPPTAWVTKM